MKLHKKRAETVIQALEEWNREELISSDLERKLKGTIEIEPFDWRRLARYSFVISIIAFIISVGSIVSDRALMKLIDAYFGAPAAVKATSLVAVSALFFLWGVHRKKFKQDMVFRNEAIFSLGVLSYAAALFYVGQLFHLETESYRRLAFVGCISYGVLGFFLQSPLIWMFSILSLGGWMGAETGYMSGWGSYCLGMNYPLRFVLFGSILTGVGLLHYHSRFLVLQKTTLVMGLVYLFISLWILSIFGNYGDITSWYKAKQIELFHWSILFGLASIAAITHGLKCDDIITRGFGLVFLFLNLYTRFFEYFWDSFHKAIFFGVIGLTLWYFGTQAERIWNFQIGNNKEPHGKKE